MSFRMICLMSQLQKSRRAVFRAPDGQEGPARVNTHTLQRLCFTRGGRSWPSAAETRPLGLLQLALMAFMSFSAVSRSESATPERDSKHIAFIRGLYSKRKLSKEELEKVTELANSKNRFAIQFLRVSYHNGHPLERDYVKAFHWHEKMYEVDRNNGAHGIGQAYKHGHGVEKDYKQAISYLLKASREHGLSSGFFLQKIPKSKRPEAEAWLKENYLTNKDLYR